MQQHHINKSQYGVLIMRSCDAWQLDLFNSATSAADNRKIKFVIFQYCTKILIVLTDQKALPDYGLEIRSPSVEILLLLSSQKQKIVSIQRMIS